VSVAIVEPKHSSASSNFFAVHQPRIRHSSNTSCQQPFSCNSKPQVSRM